MDLLAVGLQGLKLSVVRRAKQRPFWQPRYYDFNVFTEAKRIEKLGLHALESRQAWTGGQA